MKGKKLCKERMGKHDQSCSEHIIIVKIEEQIEFFLETFKYF